MVRIFTLITTSRDIVQRKGIHARFVVASLMISRSIRRDAIACIYVRDLKKLIMFYGSSIRQLRADEASAYGILNKAIKSKSRKPHSGVTVEFNTDIDYVIKKFNIDLCIVKSNIGEEIYNVLKRFNKKSILYITGLVDYELNIDCIKARFIRNLRPEQEVSLINIILDRLYV